MKAQRLTLESVSCGPTINSHGGLADEYCLRFREGVSGRGSAPQGETPSRYELRHGDGDAARVIAQLSADGLIGADLSQAQFDRYLDGHASEFGAAALFSLSCAFYEAARQSAPRARQAAAACFPRVCLNILNGGHHAYTNPVLSDFHEFLLVPQHGDLPRLLADQRAIQAEVCSRLSACPTTTVNGNRVHVLGDRGNRDSIAFLLGIVEGLGLGDDYELMIDAAAAQLWNGVSYALPLAERRDFSPQSLLDYWSQLLDEFPLRFLEDPFAEHDLQNWRALAANTAGCRVLGDDVHCGNAARVRELLGSGCLTGLVLKPDQSGTVSETLAAVDVAQKADLPIMLSHRSISTDSLVLAHLLLDCGIEYAKFGPLLTDFTAILRLNEVLRSAPAGVPLEQSLRGDGSHGRA